MTYVQALEYVRNKLNSNIEPFDDHLRSFISIFRVSTCPVRHIFRLLKNVHTFTSITARCNHGLVSNFVYTVTWTF